MTDKNGETIVDQLEALRIIIIRCLSALAIGFVPMFVIAPYVIDMLINIILRNNNITLNFFAPLEMFMLQIKVSLVLDILLCFPYITKQIWCFILPALYDIERNFIKSVVIISSCLFIIGVLSGVFLILPLVIHFGLSFATDNIKPVLGISNTRSLVMILSLIFGLMFQFPLITYSLLKAHIVSYTAIKHKRPYILVGILIASGILTPPDIISQLMLTIPTYALFEIGLFCGKKSQQQKKQ